MGDLASLECISCRGGVDPLAGDELRRWHELLGNDWKVVDHHPDICLGWGRVHITLWTHKIDGLADADFIWAAKADRLLSN